MIKAFISTLLAVGLEQDDMYHNSITKQRKPNMIYRIYKRFNRQFRDEANTYINRFHKSTVIGAKSKWHIGKSLSTEIETALKEL